jgi:hypothetical protein
VAVLWIRITLMRIRILLVTLMRMLKTLKKCSNRAHIPYILSCHLQDPDPAYHFEADPDLNPPYHFDVDPHPTFQFDADPDPQH